MAGNKRGSLKSTFVVMTILPLIFLGVIMSAVTTYKFRNEVFDKTEEELKNTAYTITNVYERMYPGDYNLIQSDKLSALAKGKEYLAHSAELLENIKEDTGTDISILYGDIRYITTIKDEKGASIIGTKINSVIANDVLKQGKASFYRNVSVGNDKYVAYYMPLHNSDNSIVGMLAVLRQAQTVNKMVTRSVIPMIIIFVVCTTLAVTLVILYSKNIMAALSRLKKFLVAVENGELDYKLNETVATRDDEIGEMGHAAVSMQHSIRKLIERDALTGLYNRRYGEQRLTQNSADCKLDGTKLCVCIGDIDFFKKINDTYGHEAGDKVLVNVATVLKSHMLQKGYVARWGGEEFLIVFENMELDKARECLCELLDKVHEIAVESEGKTIKFNMSFGVVRYIIDQDEDAFASLKRADGLLYYAKEHGRNQVVGEDDNLC